MLPYTIDNNNKLLVYRWNQQGVLNFCFVYRQKKLPSIEEAWALPIPAELTSRQGTISQVRNVAFIAQSDTPTLHTGPGVTIKLSSSQYSASSLRVHSKFMHFSFKDLG